MPDDAHCMRERQHARLPKWNAACWSKAPARAGLQFARVQDEELVPTIVQKDEAGVALEPRAYAPFGLPAGHLEHDQN